MRIILMLKLAVLVLPQPSYAYCQEFKVVEYEDSVEVVCAEELPADGQNKTALNESDLPGNDLPLNDSDLPENELPGNDLQVNDRRVNDPQEHDEEDQKNEQLRLQKLILEMNPTQPQQIIDAGG